MFSKTQNMRILIVRLSSLGDIITSMSVLQFIKKKYPNSSIDWLVDSRFTDILKDNPDLNQIYSIPLKKTGKNFLKAFYEVYKISKKLGPYDLIIDMQGLMKSAILSRCIGKNIVGFDRKSVKEGLSALLYKKTAHISFCEHILNRNFALIEAGLGIKVPYNMIMQKKSYLPYKPITTDFESYFSKDKKNIIVILGGSWSTKIYPKESLKEVLNRLKQNALILWSNDDEYTRAKWIAHRCHYVKLLPKLSLNDVKALIEKADIILGNDTGPTHMAWALNKPSVTILGCTSITRIAENRRNVTVTSKVCVNPSKINKDDTSINEIPPYEIVDAVESLYEVL